MTATLVVGGCGFTPPERSDDDEPESTLTRAAAEAYYGTLLTDQPRPRLRLRTTSGRWFDLARRPSGEATAVFFGYTHCPDVCPTTMADLGAAYRQLEPAVRDKVTVVFVTEDPARDTPRVLRRWLDRYDKDFVGLIGGPKRTTAVLEQLHLPESMINRNPQTPIEHPPGHEHKSSHGDGAGGGDYGVDHSGTVYLFGPGSRTLIYTGGTTVDQYADDLTRVAG
ncbi:SCO family protein [Solicola gregarius]|uniref:SCO family protein n=1 Tax=Solicola gregarius TaxID=2908642 RepID=A0AA46THX6_9ACTN|nr:SCO family protein [Solicola gregarius]UYM05677.1 SCO family protein [Solicola gregarius]